MRSQLFKTIARGVIPIAFLFSVYMLIRGHNAPGGGFIGGLIATMAIFLASLSFSYKSIKKILARFVYLGPATGLFLATASGFYGFALKEPYLTHHHKNLFWAEDRSIPLSSTLVFDAGVYLVVLATTLIFVGAFLEDGP